MAAPQTEKELLATLAEREDTLKRIKALQAEIAKGGFIPADQVKHNKLLAERLRLMGEQKRIEGDIKRANPTAADAVRVQMAAREQLAAAREQQRLAADRLRISQQARLLDLRERYGSVLGGAAGRIEQAGQSRFAKVAGAGLAAFGAAAGGMARSGFSGTVEQNAFDYEMKMLAREMAGAFKPVMDLMTRGANSVRRFMEGLDESGQNLVMFAGLAGGAMGIRAIGMRGLGAIAGGAMAGPAGAAFGFGAGGMATGGGAAAAGAGAASAGGGAAAAGAGGAAAGGRFAGIGRAARFGVYAAPVADAVRGYSLAQDLRAGFEAKDAAEKEKAALKTLRGLESGGLSSGLGFERLLLGSESSQKTMKAAEDRLGVTKEGEQAKSRRSVTPADFAYENVGSAYQRASLSFLSKTAMEASETGDKSSPAWANVEIGKQIVSLLETIKDNGKPTPEVK